MTTIKVDVTQECIDKGERKNSYGCMVNLAVRKHVGDKIGVSSGLNYVCIYDKNFDGVNIDLPPEVKQIVMRWDRNQQVDPFSFDLDIPDEYLKAIPVESWPVGVSLEIKTL